MKILVLNCGSSSIKYQLIQVKSKSETKLMAKGQIERIGLTDSVLTHKPADKPKLAFVQSVPDHSVGINIILSTLTDANHGVIESLNEIAAAGHRVAHGGEYFKDSAIVTPLVKQQIENCFELAPLHNPANLKGILSIEKLLPTIPQVAVFDTSFHQTMPMETYLYAIPYKYYEEFRIRRYGFHGTSHKFVAQKACDMLGLEFEKSKIITCHIGNGASVTAIKDGKSFDTSMGFTPVDGLMMGTRCGAIDSGVVLYIMDKEGLTTQKANDLINKQSGLLGISGVSSDMRDVKGAAANGNEKAQLALRMFIARLKRFIGSYMAELEGADAIVFTGGIGENEDFIRKGACEGLEFMGVDFDNQANDGMREDAVISKPNSRVKVVVACTDEELVIAQDTFRLLRKRPE
ncbi:Acetate kinase [Mucinivorans hirudinis]|uniref:Acetate kinase n=1 Tax=Mucinivorans hirudinis TaxID=1433126 RepID=A0A060R6U7_9BACT|nr:Acetate kinase [Mucinivorans hirudinis]